MSGSPTSPSAPPPPPADSVLLDDLVDLSSRAVEFDRAGEHVAAIYYYEEAAKILEQIGGGNRSPESPSKAEEYRRRAAELKLELDRRETDKAEKAKLERAASQGETDLQKAYFLLSEGLDTDEQGNLEDAVEIYSAAVELCLKAKKSTDDAVVQKKLTKVATQALERAEEIKGIDRRSPTKKAPAARPPPRLSPTTAKKLLPPIDGLNLRETPTGGASAATSPAEGGGGGDGGTGGGGKGYSEEEKRVLSKSSLINHRVFVPFLTVDLRERFAFPMPFTDRDGTLALAPKQKAKLVKWARPDEYMSAPTVLQLVDCFSVKQTVVSDCSFVASIAISAQYEKRFGKRLITSIIYPQDRRGSPVYNPCGKYMVALRINGVPRKVIVDDYLPLGPHGELLCSYSSNRNELWISLLEKAYMKVMGGYDFPGSNSNIDLYALTGWIPERVSIRPGHPDFDKDGLFRKLLDRFRKGDVLVTMATGEISEADAERAGLVPTHAYAMLDVKEVNGVKLFLLKNPWSHLRWRGNYSEIDLRHWTPDMMAALNYDPKNARNFDNGVFWIDYDSLCKFYDVVYMNWNPALFRHTYAIHHCWSSGAGPAKDLYNISNNPQYSLELAPGQTGALWILLSRHITDIEDFKNNKEYITVLVYKNDGKRVYYPFDPPPYIDGVRINSPHYLCKMIVTESTPRRLSLVVSQYEKSTTIYYTIRVYSTLPFALRKIGDPYKHRQEVTGAWKGASAGGCGNYKDTYPNNPRYQFTVKESSHVLVEMKGPKQFQIGFDLICVIAGNKESPLYFKQKTSGAYRTGFAVLPIEVTAGTYDIVPTTFKPGQEGPFFLTLKCSSPFNFGRL